MNRSLGLLLVSFFISFTLSAQPALVPTCPGLLRELPAERIRAYMPGVPAPVVNALSWIPFFYSNQIYRKTIEQKPVDDLSFNFFRSFLSEHDISLNSQGLDRVPPEGTAVIIAANHPSGPLEAFAILAELYKHRRDVIVVAAQLTEGMREMDEISFDPEQGTERKIFRALQEGKAVVIFPYGHISDYENPITGEVRDGPWKSGFIRFANRSEVPIIPTYVDLKPNRLYQIGTRIQSGARTLTDTIINTSAASLPESLYICAYQNCRLINVILGKLKMATVPIDFDLRRGENVRIQFGSPVTFDEYSRYSSWEEAAAAIRAQAYELRGQNGN